jgi:hypothetical protein
MKSATEDLDAHRHISSKLHHSYKELLPPQTCSKNDDCFAQFAPHRRTFKQNKYSDTAIIQLIGTNDLGECENRGDTSKKKKKEEKKQTDSERVSTA